MLSPLPLFLTPRLFYKSAHLQAYLMDFHLQCELHLTSNEALSIEPRLINEGR